MMKLIAFTLIGIATVGCAQAATYTLENVVQTQTPQASVPNMSISISDAAVARGSFNYSADNLPIPPVGDMADLIAFKFGNDTIISNGTGAPFYHLIVKLAFSQDTSISKGSIYYQTLSPELTLNGPGGSMSGLYQPLDGNGCQSNFDCRILSAQLIRTDIVASIPEPTSALILSGVAMTAAIRRRRSVKQH